VLANELLALVAAGLSNRQALTAATATGAALLGRADQLGHIGAGARADLVALASDPLADIAAVRSPVWVRQRGELRFTAAQGLIATRSARSHDQVVARW
jgi:imidazolonepropionase-like amidohydrolase